MGWGWPGGFARPRGMPRAPGSACVTLPCPFVHPPGSSCCWKPRPIVAALGGLRACSWVAVTLIPFVGRGMAGSLHHGEGAASQLSPQSPERSSHPCSPSRPGTGCSEPPPSASGSWFGDSARAAPTATELRRSLGIGSCPSGAVGAGGSCHPRAAAPRHPRGGLCDVTGAGGPGGGWFAPPGHCGAAAGTYSGTERVVPSPSPCPHALAMWRFPLRRRETGKATRLDSSKK